MVTYNRVLRIKFGNKSEQVGPTKGCRRLDNDTKDWTMIYVVLFIRYHYKDVLSGSRNMYWEITSYTRNFDLKTSKKKTTWET